MGLAVLISLPLLLRPYMVRGDSMASVIRGGEIILVDTLSLAVLPPRRGEILVFRNPHRKQEGDGVEVDVKRIVGLPGETVHIRNDQVVVTVACEGGKPIAPRSTEIGSGPCQKTYAAKTLMGTGTFGVNNKEFDMFLGPLDFFVLGDNRADSSDSRTFGAVQPENFIGRAAIKVFPPTALSLLYGTIE
jgi:signal peptidase I